jgi:hypothetical protein
MVDVVAELGHLNQLAEQDANKRFDRLYRCETKRSAGNRQRTDSRKSGSSNPRSGWTNNEDMDDAKVIQLSEELRQGVPTPTRAAGLHSQRNGKFRPLGIPASRDKIVQAGVTFILEAFYEPIFRKCSHGFRPEHSTITAIRQVWSAYKAGAKWIIEGDITDCFGSIPHGVILNCLRKRIKDERFIDLIRKMLQAGVMEAGNFSPPIRVHRKVGSPVPSWPTSYCMSWTPGWKTMGVNPPVKLRQKRMPAATRNTCATLSHREYPTLSGRQTPIPKNATPEELRRNFGRNCDYAVCSRAACHAK